MKAENCPPDDGRRASVDGACDGDDDNHIRVICRYAVLVAYPARTALLIGPAITDLFVQGPSVLRCRRLAAGVCVCG